MRTEAGGNPSTHEGEVVMDLADIIASLQDLDDEIGRASCRERV